MSIFSRIWPFGKSPASQQPQAGGKAPVDTGRYVPHASRNAGALRSPIAGWRGPLASSPAQAEAFAGSRWRLYDVLLPGQGYEGLWMRKEWG